MSYWKQTGHTGLYELTGVKSIIADLTVTDKETVLDIMLFPNQNLGQTIKLGQLSVEKAQYKALKLLHTMLMDTIDPLLDTKATLENAIKTAKEDMNT